MFAVYLVFLFCCYPASCFWMLDLEIPLVRLFVRQSLSFLKIESLVFLDIVHYTCCPRYPVTDKSKLLKKNGGPNLGPKGLNQAQNEFLRRLIEFFLGVAYIDSLQKCLTPSKGKTHNKNYRGPHLDQKV